MSRIIHVIGASGRSGVALCRALLARGMGVAPVVRNPAAWRMAGIDVPPVRADLTDPPGLGRALADAVEVVSCAHARHTAAILRAAPAAERFVLLGSTRKFTRWPDDHGNGVLAGEAALLASGRPGVMLHPTMIYGAAGEDNVQRLAALLRRLSVLPLPSGGRFLVQPIYQGDVTRAILAALERKWAGPEALVIAGPAAMTYADFVRSVASAAGLRRPMIVAFPAGPLIAAAPLLRLIPALPRIEPTEIRRLTENKAFDITPMRNSLGFDPLSLQEGLALTFGSKHDGDALSG